MYLLLFPFQKIFNLFKKTTGKNLIIQTAKIGDFINVTPMLHALGHSDIIMSKIIEPLVLHDDKILHYYIIEEVKNNFFKKMILLFKIMNQYDNVYLVQPNTINLFLASLCNAPNKQFLKTYINKIHHKLFYSSATGIVIHTKTDLTINSYLKLINRNFRYTDFPKHATSPLHFPTVPPDVLSVQFKGIKIGISISAGNKAKTIPASTWFQLIDSLSCLSYNFYIFGVSEDQNYLDDLLKLTGNQSNLISLIGQLSLEDVPWAISKMDFYISSDSGNAYIADAQKIPIIMFYGCCEIQEQRPLHNVLLIDPLNDIPASTFVFDTCFKFAQPAECLFGLNKNNILQIKTFIEKNVNEKLT
ncbi:glycosyltransferase family 9 protein [Candidatus Pantoea carbekii]|nr:glycosyltransferase family 9 protein [Candidatus Pantoea carbekii]